MSDPLLIRRGVNFDAYFDSYTDDTNSERIDYEGWRFTLSLAFYGNQTDRTWSTDDNNPMLTVVDATNPTGSRLAWHLSATVTRTLSDGLVTLLQIDPADESNVGQLSDPIPVSMLGAP